MYLLFQSRAERHAMEVEYEYDAPRFYDFRRTDEGTSMASRWFDEHEDDDIAGMMRVSDCAAYWFSYFILFHA